PLGYGSNRLTARSTDEFGNPTGFERSIFRVGNEEDAPVVTAGLLSDTGRSATDGLTRVPDVTGTVTDASQVSAFLAGIDGRPMTDVTGKLSNGAFTLSAADLAVLAGGHVADGKHRLTLSARDEFGNVSPLISLGFTLDTAAP